MERYKKIKWNLSDITYPDKLFKSGRESELIPSYYGKIICNEGSLVRRTESWLLGINSHINLLTLGVRKFSAH